MKAWNELLTQLDQELGTETVNTWIRPLKIIKFDAGNLYLDAIDSFQVNWFNEVVYPLLPKRLLTSSGKPIKVHLSIKGSSYDSKKKELLKATQNPFPSDPLESHAIFDQFILGAEENLPHKILTELTQKKLPMGRYNPIYIYGPKGSGKSHLLMAAAQALKERGTECFYVHASTFTEHVIRAFRSTSLQEFRKVCRDIEVLIIDDVDQFSRKIATQEELFHTFNRLHTQGLQIILSSSMTPRSLEDIEERLISRFEWGITLGLPSPDENQKKEILKMRAGALAFPLNSPFVDFLLQSFKNLHSLIQALEALALRLPHLTASPDLEIAKYHLSDLILKESDAQLTPEKTLKIVANTFGIKIEDILGKAQNKECALPRQISMYLCREKLQMSFLKIGRMFSRDHSTVMTSVKMVKTGLQKKEEKFLFPLSEIEKILTV